MRSPAAAPYLSVIVPAHNSAAVLEQCLSALSASQLPRESWELVVVDDASTDETELIAARHADIAVRLAGNPHGPAYARNRGAEASRGAILVFVDADVVVHPDTLARVATVLARRPEVSALFGSYDVRPYHQGIVSQYRNLLHHYVHLHGGGDAETFWSGLGAMRRSVFFEVGMFDEWHYARPQIEDIELGRRLRRRGHRILLDPTVQATHLKEWTFWGMINTDFRNRGLPWMWLMLREGLGEAAGSLNIGRAERACTALVATGMLGLVSAVLWRTWWPLMFTLAAVVMVLGLNVGFYRYLWRHRSARFTLGVIPFHLIYYVSNVVAVFAGWLVHVLLGEPLPPPSADALARSGIQTWPPPLRKPQESVWTIRTPAALRRPASQAGSEDDEWQRT